VASGFRDHGWTVCYFAPKEHARISEAQIIDAGLDPADVIQGPTIAHLPFLAKHDVVILPTPGGITERILYQMRDLAGTYPTRARPVLVTAYVGMVIDNIFGGFFHRASSDIICVNSRHDLETYRSACAELQMNGDNLLLSGLAIIPEVIKPQKTGEIERIVFADQLAIPKAVADRKLIYQKLIEYAVMHPDRQVIVKPRHRPDEGSFHKSDFPPERFFQTVTVPGNLQIDYTPITTLLPTIDLLLTVSSTAALEAIAEGVRVAIVSDVGIREVHGNQAFIGSGLIRSFAEIMSDCIGSPNRDWIARYQQSDANSSKVIFDAVNSLCNRRDQGGLPLVESPYFAARRAVFQDTYGFYAKRPAGGERKRPPERRTLGEAKARLRANDWSGALEVSLTALSRTPSATEHMRVAAAALSKLGRTEEAMRFLKRARQLRPGDLHLRWRHRWLKKRLWLSRVLGPS
jgi:hypothetical protein